MCVYVGLPVRACMYEVMCAFVYVCVYVFAFMHACACVLHVGAYVSAPALVCATGSGLKDFCSLMAPNRKYSSRPFSP